ncbi:MAG: molybdopterin dinucleotide binding domain-containing protein, partial [Pseudomonadota bacterium]
LKVDGAFRQHQRIREAIAETVPGMGALADIDVARREFHIEQRLMHTPTFRTASGRATFQVRALPDVDHGERLSLTTVRSEGQFNSIIYETRDAYRGTDERWCVMLGDTELKRHGLAPGDVVTLVSDHGRMPDVTVYRHDLPAGCAMAYYPEANVLTGTAVDPRSKTPAFKHTAIRIETASG